MGARPLRRVIQNKIEDKLSDALLGGKFADGDTIIIDLEVLEDEVGFVLKHTKEAKSEDEPAGVLDVEG